MARERTDPRKGAKKHTGESRPASRDKRPTKTTQKPAPRGRLGGWGIFLLSVIAICLVINVGLNLMNRIDEVQPAPEPTETLDPAMIEAQAANILYVPTAPPATEPAVLVAETATPTPIPTEAPTPTPSPTLPPTQPPPEPTFDFMSVPATQPPEDSPLPQATQQLAQTVTAAAMASAPVPAATTMQPAATRIALPTTLPPAPSPSPSPTPQPRYGKSNIDRLNIREEPDTHSDRVALVEREGVGMIILGTETDEAGDIWFYVNYGRYDGYVLAQYVTEIPESEFWPIATRSSRSTRPPTSAASTTKPTATPKTTATPNASAASSLIRPTLSTQYIGDAKTKDFHLSICVALPPKADRVELPSRGIAITNGYHPCSFCNP